MIHISCLAGEVIGIGDDVNVTVLEIHGDEVLLEIDCWDGSSVVCSEQMTACSVGAD